jgi:hypothetical protein
MPDSAAISVLAGLSGVTALAYYLQSFWILSTCGILMLVLLFGMLVPNKSIILKEAPYLSQTDAMTSKNAYESAKPGSFSTSDRIFVSKTMIPAKGMVRAFSSNCRDLKTLYSITRLLC